MSLRHVVHRRVHLERPQPKTRKNLGYLEKHKDYVKRAKDFHQKEDAIQQLHRKAYFRNEDEFAFRMKSHFQDKDGHARKKKAHLTKEELQLADSQDARYVAMREQIDKKAVAKQAERLHFLHADLPNKHIVFVDEEEADVQRGGSSSSSRAPVEPGSDGGAGGKAKKKLKDFDVAAFFDTHPALLHRKANRPRVKQLETTKFADHEEAGEAVQQSYHELIQRQERVKKLKRVRQELELRQHMRGKGKRIKVADAIGDMPAVYRWNPERKR